jgi:pyruvate formate-lyase/glycerol dehydratase family glycyl radical enzyme
MMNAKAATPLRSIDRPSTSEAIPSVPTDIAEYPRIAQMLPSVHPRKYPLCVEKALLVLESFRQTESEPQILRRAKAFAHYLRHRTIFIEEGELIVGNPAAKPMGLEAGCINPTWPRDELQTLRQQLFDITDDDVARLDAVDAYWKGHGRILAERLGASYDEEVLWPFIQSGILLPAWRRRDEGRGYGSAEGAWGMGLGLTLIVVDFEQALSQGLQSISAEAKRQLQRLDPTCTDAASRSAVLRAIIICNDALIEIAHRYAELADTMAQSEPDASRRRELRQIAATCRQVPGDAPRSFREALQFFWFLWLALATGTAAGGRFDQFMYPYYERDRRCGVGSDRDVVELLAALRIKTMQVNFLSGGAVQREKWSGFARWNNWIIGGVTRDGADATNALSYLLLDAASLCPTPHHTLTLRVHSGTPDALLLKALRLVKSGLGMPAFVGDRSYIDYLVAEGVALQDARDYALGGCLDAMVPGKSRTSAIGMFVVPLVLELTLNGGVERRTGRRLGLPLGDLPSFGSYDELLAAFKRQLAHFMALTSEEHDILLRAQRELYPDAVHSMLMEDALTTGRDVLDRTLSFENGSVLNPVGMINVADALAAVKKLVFEERRVSAATLHAALAADWQGYEEIRQLCLAAPKFGNGDRYVDAIAADLYRFWADTAHSFTSAWGGRVRSSGISITSYGPGGAVTGATPDGRRAGSTLADGAVSAAQGRDVRGPTALLRSAMTIDQTPFQSLLFNIKFHPSALRSDADLTKVGCLIRTYFEAGGKHVQFNVVDRATLRDAQLHPEQHRDLVVRVAGYSAYFVELTQKIQDEVIGRTEAMLT